VKVVIPEGNVMMAHFGAPMSGWSTILPTVVETVLMALAPAIPDRIPAGNSGTLGHGVTFFGADTRDGQEKKFLSSSIEGAGWGGRPHEDGVSGVVSVCQGDVCNGPIEAMELQVPFVVEERALVGDTGGAGKHRGGLTTRFGVRTLVEGRINLITSTRKEFPPRGLWGGMPGQVARTGVKRPGDPEFELDEILSRALIPAGTVAFTQGGGGGGWGDPLERDPEAVLADVIEEYVSPESAYGDYGVVLAGTTAVDEQATASLRSELRQLREGGRLERAPGGGTPH
jgi:N-methylhydantoinase B